jgi:leucyl aminopeptidase
VLQTRKGITVEVGNTDAEGRLVLADALTEALTEKPDLLIDVATLTGAARVALGASMPAVFTNRDETWRTLEKAAEEQDDPLWRLPLHEPYRKKLDSRVADISSTGDSLAGAITAALFLREFASKQSDWIHIDTMGYNTEALPGRPRGGEALGLRALLEMLETRYCVQSPQRESQAESEAS